MVTRSRTIRASELQVDDTVHINTSVAGRVEKIISVTDKTITYRFTYTRCDTYPSSVGQRRSNSHRVNTMLTVDRDM